MEKLLKILTVYFRCLFSNKDAIILWLFGAVYLWAAYDYYHPTSGRSEWIDKTFFYIYSIIAILVLFNPPAINSTRYYFKVKRRLQKTGGKGRIRAIESRTYGCANRGVRMAMKDYL